MVSGGIKAQSDIREYLRQGLTNRFRAKPPPPEHIPAAQGSLASYRDVASYGYDLPEIPPYRPRQTDIREYIQPTTVPYPARQQGIGEYMQRATIQALAFSPWAQGYAEREYQQQQHDLSVAHKLNRDYLENLQINENIRNFKVSLQATEDLGAGSDSSTATVANRTRESQARAVDRPLQIQLPNIPKARLTRIPHPPLRLTDEPSQTAPAPAAAAGPKMTRERAAAQAAAQAAQAPAAIPRREQPKQPRARVNPKPTPRRMEMDQNRQERVGLIGRWFG